MVIFILIYLIVVIINTLSLKYLFERKFDDLFIKLFVFIPILNAIGTIVITFIIFYSFIEDLCDWINKHKKW